MKIVAQRRNSRGAISLTFLCALAIGVVSLMMVLNARTVMTMSLTSRTENVEKANALAAAAIAETKSKILADRNYGKAGEVVVVGDRRGGEWAEVSFNESAEYSSLNNLGEGAQKLGEGGVVLDPGLIQVLAVAHVRNVKVVSYEIVMAPPLPFSLGSSGAVVAGGKSLIGGVESSGVTADGLNSDELVDGGVVANGTTLPTGTSNALTLTGEVELVGKAKYNGSYEQGPQVNLNRGTLEAISSPEELPQIDPTKYDPASLTNNWKHQTNTGAVADPAGGQVVANAPAFFGFHRYSGATRFDTNVVLNGGLIYVDGDVTLTKPLSGTGALVATGNVTIQGGADIKADALAAVVAGKDLTVVGTGKNAESQQMNSRFTGLLYSKGNLTLQDTRTIGSAIAAGTASGGSMMTIQDSEFLASPEGQDVSIVIQDFEDSKGETLADMGGERAGSEYILKPTAADIIAHPDFQTGDPVVIAESLLKIRYEEQTYSKPADLQGKKIETKIYNGIDSSYNTAREKIVIKITKLRQQGESIQTVRFDLNEFLNVSDRLKASRPYFIED